MGASVLLDGRETGVVTNGELVVPGPVPDHVVLTFRKAGHRDETRTVRLPQPAGAAVSVTLQTAVRLVPGRTQPPDAAALVEGDAGSRQRQADDATPVERERRGIRGDECVGRDVGGAPGARLQPRVGAEEVARVRRGPGERHEQRGERKRCEAAEA